MCCVLVVEGGAALISKKQSWLVLLFIRDCSRVFIGVSAVFYAVQKEMAAQKCG